nr:reverse transcriptase domain-containing protein [Tanacetum cinerariifolium]
HSKDEASEVIISFIKKTQVNLQLQVQRIRTNNGTEFKNQTIAKFFDEVGITQQFSAARMPQQNGVVERRNRTLVEATRTMLTFANLPSFLWAESIATACFTQNRSIIHKHFDKTPYQLINKRKPNIKFFRVFGCRCYLLNDYEDVEKLKAKGDNGVFVGYSKESAAFRIYNKRTRESSSSSLNDDVQQSPEEVILPSSNTQLIPINMVPNGDEASTSHNVFNERLEDAYFDARTPVLETLIIDSCYGFDFINITNESVNNFVICGSSKKDIDTLQINAPRIQSLTIKGKFDLAAILLLNVSSVIQAKLDYRATYDFYNMRMYKHHRIELLKGLILIPHIKELKVGKFCLEAPKKEKAPPASEPTKSGGGKQKKRCTNASGGAFNATCSSSVERRNSLNSAAGGNLLERRTQDVLTIIENKSKVRNSQNKSVVTTAMTTILKQFQATPSPSSVKAVEEICVTCGGAHLYYQCLAADGNTFPELRDNIQGYVAAAAVIYNQGNSGYRPPKQSYQAPTQQNQVVPLSELEKIKRVNEANMKAMQTQINNVKNKLRNEMKNSIQASMSNQTNELKNVMASFFQMNIASTSGSGSLPRNTIANPKGELKAITTQSGIVLDGPFVPIPPPFINPDEDERVEETLTDQDLAEYTIKVPHLLVQKSKPFSQRNFVVHQRDPLYPNIPYLSRTLKQKQQEKDEVQIYKFWQMFKQLHINITLADALILIPKYQKMLKALLSNKEKLLVLANTPLNENCSAVILKKLPEKLEDLEKFLIPCGFSELKCKALADLGASINLMPLSIWKKLGLPELISTHMTLELANRGICTLARIARDVFVLVGKFTFPADFVIVDYESDPRVPLILGRPFLQTAHALIDVHGEEMILHDDDERLTLNIRHDTSSYSSQPQKESINMINICDDLSEDFLEELCIRNHQSGNPTFSSYPKLTSPEVKDDVFDPDHVFKPLFPSPIPIEDIDSFLEKSDTSLSYSDTSLPEYENFIIHTEETNKPRVHMPNMLTIHPNLMLDSDFIPSDTSLPEFETFYFDIKEKNNGSNTIHVDISLSDLECFKFDFTHDPYELTSIVDSEIHENVPSATNVNLPPEEDNSPLFAYVVWIFLSFFTYHVVPPHLFSFENEDIIFDPVISNYHFSSLLPDVSHRCETFMKFNVYLKLLNESPMEILSSS